jgi:hypothetical protein
VLEEPLEFVEVGERNHDPAGAPAVGVNHHFHTQRPSEVVFHRHGLAGTPCGRSACLALRRGARRRGGASGSWLRVHLVSQPVIVGEFIGPKDLGDLGFNRTNGNI